MKKWLMICILLVILFCVGCVTEEELDPTATASPTALTSALKPMTVTATLSATATLPSTTTPVVIPTDAPIGPTDTPQPTVTPTLPPLEPPPGEIFFYWQPKDSTGLRAEDSVGFNLMRASAPNNVAEWQFTIILTNVIPLGPILLSPDRSKLATLAQHDTNKDGILSKPPMLVEDFRDIFVYDFSEASIQQLTEAQNWEDASLGFIWVPGEQAVLSRSRYNITKIPYQASVFETILSLSENSGAGITISPDGNLLIFTTQGAVAGQDQLLVFDRITGDLTVLRDNDTNLGFGYSEWSPDGSRWAHRDTSGNAFVLNPATLELLPLFPDGERVFKVEWSWNGEWLAFNKITDSLVLWDSETLTTSEFLSGVPVSDFAWSPNDDRIAATILQEDIERLIVLDVLTDDTFTLLEAIPEQKFNIYSWSPDGNWLLLSIKDPMQSGLFLLHLDSGALVRIMDATGGTLAYSHLWVSDQ